jgi:hypothetical protein
MPDNNILTANGLQSEIWHLVSDVFLGWGKENAKTNAKQIVATQIGLELTKSGAGAMNRGRYFCRGFGAFCQLKMPFDAVVGPKSFVVRDRPRALVTFAEQPGLFF